MSDKVKRNTDSTHKNSTVRKKKTKSLNSDTVREYLIDNPDFFDNNLDMLALLKPADKEFSGGVVNFQSVLLNRLQNEIAKLTDVQGSLINASRSNMTTQARIHAAVLCLFEAEDFKHLCHIVSHDWVDLLQIDTITICFEESKSSPLPQNNNIRLLKT